MPMQPFITGILLVSKTEIGWLKQSPYYIWFTDPFQILCPQPQSNTKPSWALAGPFVCLQNKIQHKNKLLGGKTAFLYGQLSSFGYLKVLVLSSFHLVTIHHLLFSNLLGKNIRGSPSFLYRSNLNGKSIANVLCVPSSPRSAYKIIRAGKESLVLHLKLSKDSRLNVKRMYLRILAKIKKKIHN